MFWQARLQHPADRSHAKKCGFILKGVQNHQKVLSRDVTIRFAFQTNYSSCRVEGRLGAVDPGRRVF